MPTLTAIILAAIAGYGASLFFGLIEGSFALLLLLATSIMGIYWLSEQLYFFPRRRAAAILFDTQHAQRLEELKQQGITSQEDDKFALQTRQALLDQPWWLDWTAGIFPVLALVFVFRSFMFEPFKIPSGSMIPTLHIGDLILVNKFHYGIRLPIINQKVIDGHPVQRGDVMVFRFPAKPSLDYIKRVVGVPGDKIAYLNKVLTINGQLISKVGVPEFFDTDTMRYSKQFEEALPIGSDPSQMNNLRAHRVLNDDRVPNFVSGITDYPFKDHCSYSVEGVECTVPAGHYFMMGDNRDNSLDSRYWGFVPDENIVGKAFFIWFNLGKLSRIGSFD
jgi:signal peptidase I